MHDPEPHLISRVLAAAHDGTAVTVYGDDYATADGTRIRDYRPSSDGAVLVIAVRPSSVLTTGGPRSAP